MDKSEELRSWAQKKQQQHKQQNGSLSKSAPLAQDRTEELNVWASKQKSSLSQSFAAVKTKSFIHKKDEEHRGDSNSVGSSTAASKSSSKRRTENDNARESYLAAKAEHVTKSVSFSKDEYAILSLGIASLREGVVKSQGFFSAGSSTQEENTWTKTEFDTMANQRLTKVTESDFCTIMPCSDNKKATWFIKSYEGWIYYLKATKQYPKFLAVEVLDSLSNIILFGLRPDRKTSDELNEYCKSVYLEYGTLEEGTKASKMLCQVDEIKEKMNANINVVLENIEDTKRLEETTAELLEQSQIFKKRTSKLKKEMWMKDKGAMIIKAGTAGAVAIGATAGFLAGGPGGAAFVAVPSVVAAEIIEMGLIASACGIGYYMTAKAAIKSWFWSQKFVKVP